MRLYTEKHPGKLVIRDVLQNYVALQLLIEATNACSTNADCVKQHLYAAQEDTILGNIRVTPDGDVKFPALFVKRFKNKRFELYTA